MGGFEYFICALFAASFIGSIVFSIISLLIHYDKKNRENEFLDKKEKNL